jgi:hypothetical protein
MTRIVAAISRLSRLVAIGFAVLALPAWAQDLPVVMGERVVSKELKAVASPYLLTTEEEMPARALRLVKPAARELGSLQPRRTDQKRVDIGFGRDVAGLAEEPAAKALTWQVVGASRIAKLRVQSPGAQALRVGIRVGSTRQPWELRVAGNADETKAIGPMRLGGPLGKTEIHWTPLTEGDAQVIELVSPASLPAPAVEVVTVSHLVAGPKDRFRKLVADIGSSEPCNIDIACITNPTQAFLDAANATVQLLTTQPGGLSSLCTGTILNDITPGTQIPYLYTANHCLEAEDPPYRTVTQMQQIASTINTFFFFDAVACNSLAVPNYVQKFGGTTYLYGDLATDVMFLRLNDWAPDGAYLAGWDANPFTVTNTPIIVLHHPYGDLKKYTGGVLSGGPDPLAAPRSAATGYWRTSYNQGITEFGSSGSGLFTASGGQYVLRGSLSTGNIFQCTSKRPDGYYVGNDWFTRFDIAFPSIRPWLQATTLAEFDVSDLWWNPLEDGRGINMTQHPSGQVFAIWYTYAADTGPLWLVMSGGQWTTSRTFVGKLYRTSGPAYSKLPFDPSKVTAFEVGTLTLNFTDANNVTFFWVVDGVQGTEVMRRQDF